MKIFNDYKILNCLFNSNMFIVPSSKLITMNITHIIKKIFIIKVLTSRNNYRELKMPGGHSHYTYVANKKQTKNVHVIYTLETPLARSLARSCQDPQRILARCLRILARILRIFEDICKEF